MDNDFIYEAIKPGMLPPMDSEKLSYYLNYQKKCCCKIKSNDENGTGFFCKILVKNSFIILPVLMTCNHVLKEDDIKIGKTIYYSLDNDKYEYNITIDQKRLVYTNQSLDFTLIQLYKNEYIDLDFFLSIDEEIFKDKPNNDLIQNSICLFHYPGGRKSSLSFGKIKNISLDKEEIYHTCGSESGSSGGPLINLLNFKVLGIHKGHKINKSDNLGQFIKPIIENFFKNIDFKKLNFKNIYDNCINFEEQIENKIEYNGQSTNKNINESQNNDKIKEDINKNFHENSKEYDFIYNFSFMFGIIKQFYISQFLLYFRLNYHGNLIYELLLYDIAFGLISLFIESFDINHKKLLIAFLIIPFLKIMISSFFYTVPFINERIIYEITKGEILGNLISIIYNFYKKTSLLDNNSLKLKFFSIDIIPISVFIISIFCIIIIKRNYSKFIDTKNDLNYNELVDFDLFIKRPIQNFLLFINYSYTFSVFPLFFILYDKIKFQFIFILSDILGRYFGSKLFNENNYNYFAIYRLILCIFIFNFLFKNNFINYIIIFIVGGLSGALTDIGYYIPLKKENKIEKSTLLFLIKNGKYFTLFEFLFQLGKL